jgi:hypothetical protein
VKVRTTTVLTLLVLAFLLPLISPTNPNQSRGGTVKPPSSLASIGIAQVYANPDWVTSDSDFITIENSYYKVQIREDSLDGHNRYGGIETIYLKPSNNQIVGSGYLWGGVEIEENSSDDSKFYSMWHGSTEPFDLSILYHTSDYVVIYAYMGISPTERAKFYYTFYYNQPYFLTTSERELNATTTSEQRQSCFIVDTKWASDGNYLDASGQVRSASRPSSGAGDDETYPFYKVSLKSQSYPWMYYHNSTSSEGIGTIFFDLFPTSTTWGLHYKIYGTDHAYSEYEINWSQEDDNGGITRLPHRDTAQTYRISYLTYITSDYNNIKTLATTLWSSTYNSEQAKSSGVTGYTPNWLLGSALNMGNGLGLLWLPLSSSCGTYCEKETPTVDVPLGKQFYAFYSNSTAPYGASIQANTYEGSSQATDGSSASVTVKGYLDTNRIKVNITFTMYNDSDKIKVDAHFYVLTNAILNGLGLEGDGYGGTVSSLGSGVYEQHWAGTAYTYIGQLYHNFTGTAAVDMDVYNIQPKVLKTTPDYYYVPANGTWSMSFYIQPWAKDSAFAASDAAGALHSSAWMTFQNHYVRLFNTTNAFATQLSLLDFDNPTTTVLYHDYSSNTLSLIVTGTGATTTKVLTYLSPTSVTGATWSFDSSTGILTLNAPSGAQSIAAQFPTTYNFGVTTIGSTSYPPGPTVDSYDESNYSSADRSINSSSPYVGQAFTMGSSPQGLVQAKLYLSKYGSPTGTMTAELFACTGTPGSTGTGAGSFALAVSGSLDVSTIIAWPNYALYTFSFPTSYVLAATTNYVIVGHYSGGSSSNYIVVGSDNTSPTHAGNTAYYGTSWHAISTYDTIFYVIGNYVQAGGYVIGSRVQYTGPTGGAVSSFSFYTATGESSDHFSLGFYNDSSGNPDKVLWYSASTGSASSKWNSVMKMSGTTANGWAGTLVQNNYYWLMWEWDNVAAGPTLVSGEANSGIYLVQTYGSFPSPWSGGTKTPVGWSYYVTYSTTVTTTFALDGVSNEGSGAILTIDSTGYSYSDFPKAFDWSPSSTHNVTATTPVSGGTGKQYVFSLWTNGDGLTGASGTYTTPASPTTVRATYTAQYQVSFTSSGIAGDASGSVVTVAGSVETQAQLPFAAWYDSGASINFNYASPVSATAGKQYVWASTSGCSQSGQSGTVTVGSSCTATGTYNVQWQVTLASSGIAGDTSGTVVTVAGSGKTQAELPFAAWYNDGSSLTYAFTSPMSATSGKQYAWTSTSGLSQTLQSDTFTVTATGTVTGTYKTQWEISFTSSGIGGDTSDTIVTVAGAGKTQAQLPFTAWYDDGASLSFSFSSPVSATEGKRYVWGSTSGLSQTLQSNSFSVTATGTVTGTYGVYQLTIAVYPSGGGSISPVVGSHWYDPGAVVPVSASAASGYSFYYWSLDGTNVGTLPSTSVLMNSDHTLAAMFRGTSSISVSLASDGFAWIISGTITPTQPSPGIPTGTPVTLSYSSDSGGTWTSFITVLTSSGGDYSVYWQQPYQYADLRVSASWNGNAAYEGSTSSFQMVSGTYGPFYPPVSVLVSGSGSVARGGLATFDVIVTSPSSYSFDRTLYIIVVGPDGYQYIDTVRAAVNAGETRRYQFVWQAPSSLTTGTYQVYAGLIPPNPAAIDRTQITVT